MQRLAVCFLTSMTLGMVTLDVSAQPKYDPGASDTEIVIGQTLPYSGPVSSYGTLGRAQVAYFQKINDEGGINGRKIRLISLDDAYSPPRTLELTRRLVERDNVLFVYSTIGTPTNTAIHRYLNSRKVPHLLLSSGATKWNDPKNYPWSIGWQPNYHNEGKLYAKYILQTKPDAKIAMLYPNDDFGKDYATGFKEGLGDKTSLIVGEATYETSDPTVDSQVIGLKQSGADVFFNMGTPKFAAQAIRKSAEVGWKPQQFLVNVSSSVGAVMKPAGFENAQGLITIAYLKDPLDERWRDDQGAREYLDFMKKYYPEGDLHDHMNVLATASAQTLVQILKQAGDDLTRENIMRQATTMKDVTTPLLLPGVTINTTPDDYAPIKTVQMMRFEGEEWVPFGEPVGN